MSGYPIVLNGEAITALVVGGGRVAERKARALLAAGARVRIVAPLVSGVLRELAHSNERCEIVERRYERGDIVAARLVFAATDQREVNAAVARDAREEGVLVNVADDGSLGDFVTPAVHESGSLLVAVTTGGVPGAASRIRDALSERFDERYADALARLAELRSSLLGADDREEWKRAADALLDEDFCARVESRTLGEELARWRYS
ncbi:MAG TPA: bifunctional precorrin-2 dehydrogenase/sirohydrochlorin ferrochelatase [Gemmatimonadaceae bacterium]|nr:bifunctional precorrin-2 dehydrogenase/sirohydrochlorin ferrochelatase [Gemmatimonadaceae bacterium]